MSGRERIKWLMERGKKKAMIERERERWLSERERHKER